MSDFNAQFEVAKKKRKKNFSQEELTVLVDEVNEHKKVLFEKFSDTLTNEKKEKYWRQIALKINAVSLVERSVDEIRKKWTDWCSITKAKASKISAEMTKTGSGTSDVVALTPLEEKIASILGRTAIEGIKGGIDAAKRSDGNSQEFSVEVTEIDEGTDNTYISDYERSPSCVSVAAVEPVHKKRKQACRSIIPPAEESEIIKIEREKLEIKRERLQIDRLRLSIEQSRLDTEKRILDLLEKCVEFQQQQQVFQSPSASAAYSSDHEYSYHHL